MSHYIEVRLKIEKGRTTKDQIFMIFFSSSPDSGIA